MRRFKKIRGIDLDRMNHEDHGIIICYKFSFQEKANTQARHRENLPYIS